MKKKRKESLSSTLEKRKEKFLSNGRICLYSSQPTWEATYVPLLLLHQKRDIELADALLLFYPSDFIQRNVVAGPQSIQ